MVIIRVNANVRPERAQIIVEGIHNQAPTGVIVLPSCCELLNEVPADEEIKVIHQDARVAELARESDCGPGCARYPRCEYNHSARGVVRINCPLWRPKG